MLGTCQMNETKLEVSESYEETELSDVDDDIFVRTGGRNGFRLEFSDISKKPLMAPRKKRDMDHLVNGFHTEVRSSPAALRVLCMPICYIIIATLSMLGLIGVIAFLSHYVQVPNIFLKFWSKADDASFIAPCDNIQVEDVWVQQFPKLLTESAFRLVDVNGDKVDDIIFGYATGADGYNVPKFVCDIYFQSQSPCFGGVLALNGKDGSELWRFWTEHEVFALNCNEDLTQDGTNDCLVAGRAGVFYAINGRNGTMLWKFSDENVKNPIMNFYTPQFVRDLNDDGVLDVLMTHGGDPLAEPSSPTRLTGKLILLNGKSGETLQWLDSPDQQEIYYSPQILTKLDGTDWVLFGTGGETHGGGLYVISMQDLFKGSSSNIQTIYKDSFKGIMVPPVLTDVTNDGIQDIVMAMFNSTVVAFDGNTFVQIWNYTFPSSETYTTPTPGFFNEDTIPDFLVKYQTGPGFPVYYHAQTTVLDGRTGLPLLQKPIMDSVGSQSSTPLIRVQGYGNDIFLYWSSNCKGFEGNSTKFAFAKGTTVHEQSRSDFCKLRFDSTFVNQLRAFNRATGLPGFMIYDSEFRNDVEHAAEVDTSLEGQAYLQKHPEMWQYFGQDDQQDYTNTQNQNGGEQDGLNNENLNFKDDQGRQRLPDTYGSLSYKMSPSQLEYMNKFNIPFQASYNLPHVPIASQPELTENINYPVYHNVRKHTGGNYFPQSSNNDDPISVNRRGRMQIDVANNWGVPQSGSSYRGETLPAPIRESSYSTGGSDDLKYGQYRTAQGIQERTYPQWSYKNGFNNHLSRGRRVKRHIGPHDIDGIQRLISTGTLAKPLNASSPDPGIDFIFATYWFQPAKTEAIVFNSDDCIQKKLLDESMRFDESSKYYGMDHDSFEDTVRNECKQTSEAGELNAPENEKATGEKSSGSQSGYPYDPFDIHMGQMTVYRLHISCTCSESSLRSGGGGRRCGKILEEQPWTGYMGSHADSYFPYRATSRAAKANVKPNPTKATKI